MAYNTGERPGTLNLRGRGEYVNTKVRTSDRQISDQAEPRDYDPLRSDIWNLHKSSYNRISDLTHNEYHSTTRDSLDRTIQERARLPPDRSHPLHVMRSFGITDTALSRHLRQLDTGVLPEHPTNHAQHSMQSTYGESYGTDGQAGTQRQPRCQPAQTADKWMQFRRRKSWMFDTDCAPSAFTDDSLTCPPIPREVRACIEAAQDAGDTCRTADELEMQVAALQHKMSEAHYPEPVTDPAPPAEPRGTEERSTRDGPPDVTEPQSRVESSCEPGLELPADTERRGAHRPCSTEPGPAPGPVPATPAVPAAPAAPAVLAAPADLDYPAARRLAGPCAPPERDLSAVFPAVDGRQCPGPPPPAAPPPCPRGPVPCAAVPVVPCCRAVPPPPGRYRSTYTAGYADPDAGLRAAAAPRSGAELYRDAAPLPRLAAGTSRCLDGLTQAVHTDRPPAVGPTTAAACEETV